MPTRAASPATAAVGDSTNRSHGPRSRIGRDSPRCRNPAYAATSPAAGTPAAISVPLTWPAKIRYKPAEIRKTTNANGPDDMATCYAAPASWAASAVRTSAGVAGSLPAARTARAASSTQS